MSSSVAGSGTVEVSETSVKLSSGTALNPAKLPFWESILTLVIPLPTSEYVTGPLMQQVYHFPVLATSVVPEYA